MNLLFFQRMSVIISQEELGQMLLNYCVTVKGAAEVLKPMVSIVMLHFFLLRKCNIVVATVEFAGDW